MRGFIRGINFLDAIDEFRNLYQLKQTYADAYAFDTAGQEAPVIINPTAAAVATGDVGSRDSAGKPAGMEGGRVPLLTADALPASESVGSSSGAQQRPLHLSVDRTSTSSNV